MLESENINNNAIKVSNRISKSFIIEYEQPSKINSNEDV